MKQSACVGDEPRKVAEGCVADGWETNGDEFVARSLIE